MPASVVVDCPRPSCTATITLTVDVPGPVPGPNSGTAEVVPRIRDLPERFAEHYREHHPAETLQAGIARLGEDGRAWLGTLLNGITDPAVRRGVELANRAVTSGSEAAEAFIRGVARRGLTADLVELDEPYGADHE